MAPCPPCRPRPSRRDAAPIPDPLPADSATPLLDAPPAIPAPILELAAHLSAASSRELLSWSPARQSRFLARARRLVKRGDPLSSAVRFAFQTTQDAPGGPADRATAPPGPGPAR